MNFFVFIFTFYLILFSILGYGNFFFRFIINNNYSKNNNLYVDEEIYSGFFGILFITIISLIVTFFLQNKIFFNLIFHIIGIFLFLFQYFQKNKKPFFNQIILLSLVFLSALFISKTNEDFGYYHLPIVKYFTEEKIVFGISNIGHGYKFLSSLFNFNSLMVLPKINYYSFHFIYLNCLIFFNYFCIKKIFSSYESKITNILFLFAFSFFNLSFTRIAEYGTDKVGQLIICLVVLDFIAKFFNNNKGQIPDYIFIFSPLLCLVITMKLYFITWSLLLVVFLINIRDKKIIFNFLSSRSFCVCVILSILYFITVLLQSGCFFPLIENSCFDNLFWRIPASEVNYMSQWLEFWSKSGATPNYTLNVSRADYISNFFSWFPVWFNEYFISKVSDQLGIMFFLIILIIFLFIKLKFRGQSKQSLKKILPFYLIIIFLFLFWLNKHPQLRYGGYAVTFILFSILLILLLNIFSLNINNFTKKKIYFVLIVILFFNIKNISRIHDEFNRNDIFKFNHFPYYALAHHKTKTLIELNDLKIYKPIKGHCWDSQTICSKEVPESQLKIKSWKSFYIVYKNLKFE